MAENTKLGIIYTLTKDGYTLEHYRSIDDLGFFRESFEMRVDTNKGTIHYPLTGMMKVRDYDKDSSITYPTDYTRKEYREIFDEEVKSVINYEQTTKKSQHKKAKVKS